VSDDVERFSDVTCLRETAKAIQVRFDDNLATETWIPKSVIHDDSEVYAEGHTGELVVARWFAEKEGLA